MLGPSGSTTRLAAAADGVGGGGAGRRGDSGEGSKAREAGSVTGPPGSVPLRQGGGLGERDPVEGRPAATANAMAARRRALV